MALARQGRLDDPPVIAPRGVRPFLHFTRLPDKAVAVGRRVLDDDQEFRCRVRDATSEEVVGRPSWIFLDRPEGWEEELERLALTAAETAGAERVAQAEADAIRRLPLAKEARRRAEEETSRLGAVLAESKERVVAERRARHLADSEVGRLRKRVAELEAALATVGPAVETDAEPTGQEPVAEEVVAPSVEEGGPQTGTASTPLTTEVGSAALIDAVTASVAALEALAEALAATTPRLAPLEPQAPALGALPASTRTPESSGPSGSGRKREGGPGSGPWPARRPTALPPGMLDDRVEAAEHLVRLEGVLVLVDGYNVTKLARGELPLAEQRQWLADAAVELAARSGARLELVFDGAGDASLAPAHPGRRAGVQVCFSPAGVEADDVVLDLVAGLAPSQTIVVATDDRRVRDGARQLGANVITSPQLLAVLRRSAGC